MEMGREDLSTHQNVLSMFDVVKREQGVWAAIRRIPAYIYKNYIRQLLPTWGYVEFNKVPIDIEIKVGDRYLPENWIPRSISYLGPNFEDPTYESALGMHLRNRVREGDQVVVVGAGWGVTSVIAARRVGNQGHVEAFEGAKKMVDEATKAIHINNVETRVNLNHCIVEADISLYDEAAGARTIKAADLPVCDVLELDCEGAEKHILPKLNFRPRVIIVETHGILGAPTDEIQGILSDMGYCIDSVDVADEGWEERCLSDDIMVICASCRD